MDDPNIMGASTGQPTPQQVQEYEWHREQQRRSLDVIRVKNPTNEDFYVEWDHGYHRVPARGTADVYRFIAVKYCRDMKDKMIHEQAQELHDKKLKERTEKGHPAYKDKYTENWETYMTSEFPKTNDWQLAARIYAELWVGLVSEYNKATPRQVNPRAGEVDMTPPEQKILESLQTKRVVDAPATPVQQPMAQPAQEPTFANVPANPFKFGEMKENLSKEELEKEITA